MVINMLIRKGLVLHINECLRICGSSVVSDSHGDLSVNDDSQTFNVTIRAGVPNGLNDLVYVDSVTVRDLPINCAETGSTLYRELMSRVSGDDLETLKSFFPAFQFPKEK